MAVKDSSFTKQDLHDLFRYENGKLFWKTINSGRRIDVEAGWLDKLGYRYIGLGRKTYRSYHLIYMMFYGYLPKLIDHIDGNPLNNQVENLREASSLQNSWNQKKRCTNTSGVKGISWSKKNSRWVARCMINYKSHFVGSFESIDSAEEAIKAFRVIKQGQFARHL